MDGFPRRHGSIIGTIGAIAALTILVGACSSSSGGSTAPSAAPVASPVASAATTQIMTSGMFHDVDGTATGEAQLIVTPSGAYEVTLENFKIGSIAHTNIVLVSNADVTASADIDKTKLLDLGPLKATEGMQDFLIPAAMNATVMDGYHTAVLWDTEMAHAIAAAPLKSQ